MMGEITPLDTVKTLSHFTSSLKYYDWCQRWLHTFFLSLQLCWHCRKSAFNNCHLHFLVSNTFRRVSWRFPLKYFERKDEILSILIKFFWCQDYLFLDLIILDWTLDCVRSLIPHFLYLKLSGLKLPRIFLYILSDVAEKY